MHISTQKSNTIQVIQCANDNSSHSGTEVVFNHRWELQSNQKQLSSDQDIQIERTLLIL